MSRYPRVKFPQFLSCYRFIEDESTSLRILDKIEELAYGTQESRQLLKMFKKNDCEKDGDGEKNDIDFLGLYNHILEKYDITEKTLSPDDSKKKKAIKEGMIENYLIKLKRERGLTLSDIRGIMLKINLRLFLKILSTKNIIVKNGEIVEIIDLTLI